MNSNAFKPKRIFCYDCNESTDCVEPIIIRRYQTHSFSILATCKVCNQLKSWAITDFYKTKFPSYFFDLKLNKSFLNYIGNKKIIDEIYLLINEPVSQYGRNLPIQC